MSLTQSTTIAEDKDAKDAKDGWIATDVTDTPMGAATDTATLDRSTLVPRQRTVKQCPATIHIEFAGDKASGAIDRNGNATPIAVDLGGSLFADGPGAPQAILPAPRGRLYHQLPESRRAKAESEVDAVEGRGHGERYRGQRRT